MVYKSSWILYLLLTACLIVCFGVGYVVLTFNTPGKDNFSYCDWLLSTDKQEYSVGDTIVISFEMTAKKPVVKRVFLDPRRSLSFAIRGDRPDENYSFAFPNYPDYESAEWKLIEISPEDPLTFEINCVISKSDDKYILDAGEFGVCRKSKIGSFGITGHWQPVNLDFFDSNENSCEGLHIFIKPKQSTELSALDSD